MASSPLYVVLCSGEHEKLQMAGAVSEPPVEVFIGMNGHSHLRQSCAGALAFLPAQWFMRLRKFLERHP